MHPNVDGVFPKKGLYLGHFGGVFEDDLRLKSDFQFLGLFALLLAFKPEYKLTKEGASLIFFEV